MSTINVSELGVKAKLKKVLTLNCWSQNISASSEVMLEYTL